MAAAGEKTLAHSRSHVIDLSTESGNLFKMAANIKSERIWVQGLETGEKQTKWRQRQTRKKLKICMNSLTSHRNTVEWYSDLIFCSMTFISFKPERSSVHGTLKKLSILDSGPFSPFSLFAYPECQRFSFLLSWKGELFLTVSAIYFILGISRTDLWSQEIFCHDTLKPLPLRNSTKPVLIRRHFKLTNYCQFCNRSSWGFWLLFFYLYTF